MNKFNTTPNAAEKNAQKYFARAEQSPDLAKKARKKERAYDVANTAKLRVLRLAKEAADKEAAEKLAAEPGQAKPAPKRAARQRRPALQRLIY